MVKGSYLCRTEGHRGISVFVDHPTGAPRVDGSTASAVKIMRRSELLVNIWR
ncbi:hypothetical protein SAMN04488000_12498 [Lentzea albida]|uniref:Uncharacterized protein n=1 Tax=Lentzea albida TaxID=65499 RepID=A0A1H9WTF0_9PSEU|nr:hypothetical protein SAMN04488000_12498 [Lentzea albida]